MENALIFSALLLGFSSGFHCLGMCGPIALSLGLSKKQQVNYHLQNLTYQLGRVFTYSFLGAILGIVGKGFQLAGLQSYLSILAGVTLIIMAVFSFSGTDFASKLPFFSRFLLKVKLKLGKLLSKTDYSSRFLTGILNGLLPCGMVYMALTASLAAGGIWQSATFMFLFGLGTFPFMFLAVLFGNLLTSTTRNRFLRIIPLLLLVLGSLFILRGLNLGIPYLSPPESSMQIHDQSKEKMHGDHSSCH